MVFRTSRQMTSDKPFFHTLIIAVVRYARHHGFKDSEIGELLDMDLSSLDLSRFQLDPELLLRMIRTLSGRIQKPLNGLQLTRFMKIGDFGIAGYVLMNCRNMMQVQEKYRVYYRLMGNVTDLRVTVEEQQAVFSWSPTLEIPPEIEQIVMEYLVASIVLYSEELTGKRLPITAVAFNFPEPEDITEFVELLGTNVSFNKKETSLVFDKSYLDLPLITANSDLLSVFDNHAQERYEKLIQTASCADRVSQILRAALPRSPNLEAVAAGLGLSSRTLQLYLRDEGTTFLKLRDQARYQYACKVLEVEDCPAAEIGLRLGFSEPSAFFRSFKRWSGVSPGRFRQESRARNRTPG